VEAKWRLNALAATSEAAAVAFCSSPSEAVLAAEMAAAEACPYKEIIN